jgi:hypothetical protein
VIEKRVEHYADGFAARYYAKRVEGEDEIEGYGAWQADSEGAEGRKEERGQDFEWDFQERIGQEEGREWVSAVFVLVVENLESSVEGKYGGGGVAHLLL